VIIVVAYDHPQGTVVGVAIGALRASDPAEGRPVMTIRNARCRTFGSPLTERELGARAKRGGDCFDARFRWI